MAIDEKLIRALYKEFDPNLSANKVQANGGSGNIMKAIFHVMGGGGGSFVGRVFSKSRVGRDKL